MKPKEMTSITMKWSEGGNTNRRDEAEKRSKRENRNKKEIRKGIRKKKTRSSKRG